MKKLTIVANGILAGWWTWSALGLVSEMGKRGYFELGFFTLLASMLIGLVFCVLSVYELFNKGKLAPGYSITGILLYGWIMVFGAEYIFGPVGLALILATRFTPPPQSLVALLMMFNLNASWDNYRSNIKYREPTFKFEAKSNLFLSGMYNALLDSKGRRFELPQVSKTTWKQTFTQTMKFETTGGAYFKVKAGTEIKMTEVAKASWGSTYKMEASKPVSIGYGMATIKFKEATFEYSENQNFKLQTSDMRGNTWLTDFIKKTSFDFRGI